MEKLLEKHIQAIILEYLPYIGIFAWRTNSGVIFSGGHAHRMAPPGTADIIGILPDGRFIAIEVKRPGGVVSDKQKEFLEKITSRGGVGFVAYSLDDVINEFKK